jgi:hypothetical protein
VLVTEESYSRLSATVVEVSASEDAKEGGFAGVL